MKLTTAFATISMLSAAAHAAECDMKLNAAVATTAREKCEDASGFDFGLSTPTAEIVAKFCKSEACMTVWQDVKTLGLPECAIYGKQLYKDVLDPLEKACKQGASGTASSSKTSASNAMYGHGSKKSHASGSMDSSDAASAAKAPRNSSASTPAPSSFATTATLSTSLSAAAVVSIVVALV